MSKLTKGLVEVDVDRRLVMKDGKEIQLTPRGFDLLVILKKAHGRILTREHLCRELGSPERALRAIDVHVREVRKLLGHDIIKTSLKAGYRYGQ